MSFSGICTYKAGSISRTCAGLRGLNGASRKPPEESKGTQETEVQLAMHTISCQPFEITVQDKDSKVHTLKFAAPILVPASGLQTTEEEVVCKRELVDHDQQKKSSPVSKSRPAKLPFAML